MSRVRGVGFVLLIAVMLVGATVPGATAASQPVATPGTAAADDPRVTDADGRPAGAPDGRLNGTQQFERTIFVVNVTESGDARWTFRYERPLANDTEVEQFQEFADRFESENTTLYSDFVSRARALVRFGTNETDREMQATAFSRRASVRRSVNDIGVVEMSFTWTNFANRTGNRVVVSDVFDGGFYITASQQLRFERGPGLAFRTVRPEPTSFSGEDLETSDTVTWQGERQFADRRPLVAYSVLEATPTDDGGGGGGSTTATPTRSGTPSTTGSDLPWTILLGILALLVGVTSVVVWRRRGAAVPGGAAETEPRAGGGTSTDGPTEDSTSGGATEPDAAAGSAAADETLLTDEERVRQLLKNNGGRMKQVNIVDETGWSKSKVSMLLSDMEEDGEISKLRVGRENIISLHGYEPEAAGSPFEDED